MDSVFSTFLEDCKEGARPPFVVGSHVLITCDVSAEQVHIKGDFDAWGEGLPMQKKDHLWWVLVEWEQIESFSYKFLADGEWMCDPHNPYISFGPEAYNSCIPAPQKGGIVYWKDVYAPTLGNHRDVFVYVPASVRKGDIPYVLFAQDGVNVFCNPQAPFGHWNLDITLDELIAQGLVPPLLVVAVDTPDRMNEYSWTSFQHETEVTPKLEEYSQFLQHTVHPMIVSHWNCREDVAVMGSSLGGSSAFWMAWQNPSFFSRVASFSGSFWMQTPSMMEIVRQTHSKRSIRMYLDAGDTAADGSTHDDADNCGVVNALHTILCNLGYTSASPVLMSIHSQEAVCWEPNRALPTEGLCMIVGRGHQHREEDWAKRVGWALQFLYHDVLHSSSQ